MAQSPRCKGWVSPKGPAKLAGRIAGRFASREDGLATLEYALILALVCVACLVTVTTLVNAISLAYQKVANGLR